MIELSESLAVKFLRFSQPNETCIDWSVSGTVTKSIWLHTSPKVTNGEGFRERDVCRTGSIFQSPHILATYEQTMQAIIPQDSHEENAPVLNTERHHFVFATETSILSSLLGGGISTSNLWSGNRWLRDYESQCPKNRFRPSKTVCSYTRTTASSNGSERSRCSK